MGGGGDTVDLDGVDQNTLNQPSTSSMAASQAKVGDHNYSAPSSFPFIALKSDLTLIDLKLLYYLTLFDEMLTPYSAEVPSCWNELVQAQKQRRHPHNIRPGDDGHLTKTWRLHNDA